MADIAIRAATADDVAEVYEIWYQSEVAGDPSPPPRGRLDYVLHIVATGQVMVAERAGRLEGFAAIIVRDAVVFLSDLFVRQESRSHGVGALLLRHLLPHDGRTLCTLASTDHRALALYVRTGMQPRWPNLWLRGPVERLADLPPHGLQIQEGHPDDPALVEWDARICGRQRPQDLRFLTAACAAVPLWFLRDGQRVGYGYVQLDSPESLWSPGAATLGPIGARSAEDAVACTCAAVEWARRAPVLRAALPGPHPALPILLAGGMHITYVETFLCSTTPFVDVTRYLPSGSGLF